MNFLFIVSAVEGKKKKGIEEINKNYFLSFLIHLLNHSYIASSSTQFLCSKGKYRRDGKALHLLHEHFMCVETIRAHESFAVEAVLHLRIGYAALITNKAILAASPCRTSITA